jgi:hypothetical protein
MRISEVTSSAMGSKVLVRVPALTVKKLDVDFAAGGSCTALYYAAPGADPLTRRATLDSELPNALNANTNIPGYQCEKGGAR